MSGSTNSLGSLRSAFPAPSVAAACSFSALYGATCLAKRPASRFTRLACQAARSGCLPSNFDRLSQRAEASRAQDKGAQYTGDCVFNGVDQRYFDLSSDSGDYILFLGRADVHMKGLDLLVAAFARISESYPNLRLKMAGRAEKTQTALLHELVSTSGVEA